VGDVRKRLLSRYALDIPAGALATLAQNAKETGLASAQPVDTAARSREIFNTEFADYLKRRMDNRSDDDHQG